MPTVKHWGGRPSKTAYLEGRIVEIMQFAREGQTIEAIAAEMGVSRRTLSPFMKSHGIERNRDAVNNTAQNDTPDNRAIIKRQTQHHVRRYLTKYGLLSDDNSEGREGRCRTNRQKVGRDTIESEAGFIAAKCLKNYEPTDDRRASFGTYLCRALETGMAQVSRLGYDNARFINLSTSSNLEEDEGPSDSITGRDMGVEHMLAVDADGNALGLMAGKGFESMLMETSWARSPHVHDKRIFHCFQCDTDFRPHSIARPSELPAPEGWPARYACPFCRGRLVFFSGMSVPGLFSGHETQRRAHAKWERFFPRTYKVLESASQYPKSTCAETEGEQYDATGKVRAGKIGVARRVCWQGPVYCARKLLRSLAEPYHTNTEWLRKLPIAHSQQVQSVSHGMAS